MMSILQFHLTSKALNSPAVTHFISTIALFLCTLATNALNGQADVLGRGSFVSHSEHPFECQLVPRLLPVFTWASGDV